MRRFVVLIVAMVLALVFLTGLVYMPLWKNLSDLTLRYRQEQEKLDQIKKEAGFSDKVKAKVITSADEIPQALAELTKKARVFGVSFDTIKQRDMISLDKDYKILPIYIEATAEFQGLVGFLGSLENLRKSVIVVDKLDILRGKELLPRLKANIELGIYLAL